MKEKLKFLFAIFLINFSITAIGQTYLLPNEINILCFKTKNDKVVVLAKDKSNGYIIYRFGTANKIEFEFPSKTKDSWSKFKYSYYSRGGGKKNAAENLSHVSFTNGHYKYFLYDCYYSESDEFLIGIQVINLKNGKSTDIKGKIKTKKGSLTNFNGKELLEIDEEI